MAIKVACACGKKLSVKDEHAGKRVKCPACGSVLVIPKRKRLPKERAPKSGDVCPNCSAPMEPESMLCVSCYFHKERGPKSKKVVKRKVRRPFSIRYAADGLFLTEQPIEEPIKHVRTTRGPVITLEVSKERIVVRHQPRLGFGDTTCLE
jgi:DNA-directed RNA polymerase subunit RPC12/RpoP